MLVNIIAIDLHEMTLFKFGEIKIIHQTAKLNTPLRIRYIIANYHSYSYQSG